MEAVHDEDEASTQQCDTMSEENCDSESDREWSEDEQEKERSSTGHAERLPSSSGESKNVPSAAPSARKKNIWSVITEKDAIVKCQQILRTIPLSPEEASARRAYYKQG
eukprot:scaffold40361_cov221-Amphora_coffeaeformis.AAC.7